MILDWVFYHDTMYKFSSRHWYGKRKEPNPKEPIVISKASFSPLRQLVSMPNPVDERLLTPFSDPPRRRLFT